MCQTTSFAPRGLFLLPWTEGSAHHLAARKRTSLIDIFAEAEQVADYAAVEQGAVGVGVGEVGGLEVEVAELVEYRLRGLQLLVAERAKVENEAGSRLKLQLYRRALPLDDLRATNMTKGRECCFPKWQMRSRIEHQKKAHSAICAPPIAFSGL